MQQFRPHNFLIRDPIRFKINFESCFPALPLLGQLVPFDLFTPKRLNRPRIIDLKIRGKHICLWPILLWIINKYIWTWYIVFISFPQFQLPKHGIRYLKAHLRVIEFRFGSPNSELSQIVHIYSSEQDKFQLHRLLKVQNFNIPQNASDFSKSFLLYLAATCTQ